MLKFAAPAKLNLTLEVLGKRPDGFHEIRSVLQAVSLCDTLSFEKSENTIVTCDLPGWSVEASLVTKAVDLLRETAGFSGGVNIRVDKHIPLMSGLGGDSSDAAVVLRGLNELGELGLTRGELVDLAAQLGSDVVFFLYGGTALAEGRGDKITPLPPISPMSVVIVVPGIPREPGKTGRMYAALNPGHYTDGSITSSVIEIIRSSGKFYPRLVFNTFENIAFRDFTLRRVHVEHLLKLGAADVYLAGSGPALFTMFEEEEKARDLFTRCKMQGMEAYLVRTL
ncbi:MAG: 4-(cytidine 5'-diphospho)-2-C-methyl-D-erythritol kinase [Chloroflexi bacterium RBG_16_56_11]|nr:MAG: 4-(cytidine 5'-diphospho)-2-C-methyl-D-erythritol kinase [Chloroflexi bacterium RBG_16_56_11]